MYVGYGLKRCRLGKQKHKKAKCQGTHNWFVQCLHVTDFFSSPTFGNLTHPGCAAHLLGAVLWTGLVKWLGSLLWELFLGVREEMGELVPWRAAVL